MRVALVYLYVVGQNDPFAPPPEHYVGFTTRFIESYRKFNVGIDHDLVVVSCGGPVGDATRALFPEAKRFMTYTAGWSDIGAYQQVASELLGVYDFQINCNSHVYFWRSGFLRRMIESRIKHGDGLFGPTASFECTPHIRTCCCAFDPATFVNYPWVIDTRNKAGWAECGAWSITKWFQHAGFPTILVAADGDYQTGWRHPPNVFRRGDQSNCLVRDKYCDQYDEADENEKCRLEQMADGGS